MLKRMSAWPNIALGMVRASLMDGVLFERKGDDDGGDGWTE